MDKKYFSVISALLAILIVTAGCIQPQESENKKVFVNIKSDKAFTTGYTVLVGPEHTALDALKATAEVVMDGDAIASIGQIKSGDDFEWKFKLGNVTYSEVPPQEYIPNEEDLLLFTLEAK